MTTRAEYFARWSALHGGYDPTSSSYLSGWLTTVHALARPFVALRVPKLFNLRTDPFERADITSNTYFDWYMSKAYLIMAGSAVVGEFLKTFKEFPPRQKSAAFNLDEVMRKMSEHPGNG